MMEWFTGVELQKAFLAKEGLRKTINTAKRSLGSLAVDAFRKTRQQWGRFQLGTLVHEFI